MTKKRKPLENIIYDDSSPKRLNSSNISRMEALTKNSIKLLFQNNYDYLVKGSPILQVNNIIFQLCGLKNIPNPPNWMIDIVLLIFDTYSR